MNKFKIAFDTLPAQGIGTGIATYSIMSYLIILQK